MSVTIALDHPANSGCDRPAVVRRFTGGEGSPNRATVYRWIDRIIVSGKPTQVTSKKIPRGDRGGQGRSRFGGCQATASAVRRRLG